MNNVLTVDVEDYFQVTAFERDIPRHSWKQYESRVESNTCRLLEILDRHDTQATFFVLGWIARNYPKLVEEIQSAGHEIGSHSYWHRLVYQQTRQQFRDDSRLSRDVIQNIIGQPVTAYRAPSFSITNDSLWALDVLVEERFRVDSSIFPIHHDRYGIPAANCNMHAIETSAGTLWEIPPSVVQIGRLNLPLSGGGYFRLLPLWTTKRGLTRIQQTRPIVFYIHPWELDPDQPRLQAGSIASRFRHHVNLQSTERKLNAILSQFRFGPIPKSIPQQAEAIV